MNEPELSAALLDVRRAYRLVYAYQRRVCDVLQGIADVVRQQDIVYAGWKPLHNSPPPRTSTPFFQAGTWAWDMLPMYAFRCEWGDEAVRKGIRRRVSVLVHADDGFRAGGGEPDPTDFAPVDASRSRLVVSMWTVRGRGADWGAADHHARELLGKAEFALGEAAYTLNRIDIDLAKLAEADSLDALVLGPMRAWGAGVHTAA